MRFWENAKGDLITDEQVLAYVASHGSLSAALTAGDIVLVSSTTDAFRPREGQPKEKGRREHAKLASFL